MPKPLPSEDPERRYLEAFAAWLGDVDRLVLAKWGLRLDDLPDLLTRDAFDAGTTPDEFFREEVMPMMRREFGSIIDVGDD